MNTQVMNKVQQKAKTNNCFNELVEIKKVFNDPNNDQSRVKKRTYSTISIKKSVKEVTKVAQKKNINV